MDGGHRIRPQLNLLHIASSLSFVRRVKNKKYFCYDLDTSKSCLPIL